MSSEINFLIHTNAANAFRQGVITERNSVTKVLDQMLADAKSLSFRDNDTRAVLARMATLEEAIGRIKGEQK